MRAAPSATRILGVPGESDDARLRDLPVAYAVALRLAAADTDDHVIGAALGVPAEAVPGILELAHAKLAALTDDSAPDLGGDAE